jgi:hypothetical protein
MIFLYSFSGCIENSYQNIEEYEFIKISKNDIENSLKQAKQWVISNIKNDGFSNYLYDYNNNQFIDNNNFVNQLKLSRLISELSNQNESFKEIHLINVEYIIQNNYLEVDNLSYVFYQNKSDIIYNALFLRILLASPNNANYTYYINKISDTIIYFQNENGSFISNIYSKEGNKSKLNLIYSEEIILSLIEMYNFTNDIKYLDKAILFQNYIIDNYLENINEDQYFILIPGHSKSLKKLYDITKDKKYDSFLLFLNNKLIDFQETENLTRIGHFYNLNFNNSYISDSALDAYIIDGFTEVYQLFENNSLNESNLYKIRILIGAYNLIQLQYNQTFGKINGAIKFNHNNSLIRIDSNQYSIDAYINILNVFNGQENWDYLYYPELDLLISNNTQINIEDYIVWYALFFGVIFSVIFVFILYIILRLKIKLK